MEVRDVINVQDDTPKITLGTMNEKDDNLVPSFYISLNIHDWNLHNCMLDSRASHNLMPKEIMEKLGLDITQEYKDLYSFDS